VTVSLATLILYGRCRGTSDPDYTEDDPDLRVPPPHILRNCFRCPVREECLAYALETEAPDGELGIWGGTTAYQRRQLKAERTRVHCPACRSDAVMKAGYGEVCISCGMSWRA